MLKVMYNDSALDGDSDRPLWEIHNIIFRFIRF